ncbi:excisionase [Nocardioides nitrophenolicus]|uniref:excisionase n=1 Tax=Nocardioides nitrophenolicus TaxID=60489 RepID=UPI001EF95972|nr:excisionase [Nocardioides nitrophenolicus]MBM7518255.1 excisionase family DNA binding protein [Nocardioides nitrophenolicus]
MSERLGTVDLSARAVPTAGRRVERSSLAGVDPRVNSRQLDVLKWIDEGCLPGRWPPDDYSHTLSASALANRGLVTVKGRGPRWSATITDDGSYYLEHGAYPPGHRFAPHKRGHKSAAAGVEPETPETPRPDGSNETHQAVSQDFPIDSPRRIKQRSEVEGSTTSVGHPWEDRVLISVKEAAWVLSLSTRMVYEAVRNGDIDRVFIGQGTTNYRLVYDSVLAWVNSMPTEPVRSW